MRHDGRHSRTPEVSYNLPEWKLDRAGGYDALHRFAVTQRDFFRALAPIPGAPAVLRRLSARDIRIRIITQRLFIKYVHEKALDQTVEWLEHHGIPYWDLCFMKDKAAVGADLYLEDSPGNIEKLRAARQQLICVSNSTNRHIGPPRAETWADIERLVTDIHEAWKLGRGAG